MNSMLIHAGPARFDLWSVWTGLLTKPRQLVGETYAVVVDDEAKFSIMPNSTARESPFSHRGQYIHHFEGLLKAC
jgi:hypothetical protein